jgi:hypothetical protein
LNGKKVKTEKQDFEEVSVGGDTWEEQESGISLKKITK